MTDNRPLALGCMRLSTEPDRDEAAAIVVLHAALDAGVTLLDTADAYCWTMTIAVTTNDSSLAPCRAGLAIDPAIVVATKGGLTRPDGRWVPTAGRNTWPRRSKAVAARWASSGSISISFTRPTRVSRWRRASAPLPI